MPSRRRFTLPADAATWPPKQVRRVVAEHLADVLPGSWTVLRDGLTSTTEGRRTRIELQSMSMSRTGHLVLAPRVAVEVAAVRAWTTRHLPGERVTTRVLNSLLMNVTEVSYVDVVSDPRLGDEEETSVDDLVRVLVDDVQPVIDLLADPERVVRELPEAWVTCSLVSPDLLIWLITQGRPDLVWPLMLRCVGEQELSWFAAALRAARAGADLDAFAGDVDATAAYWMASLGDHAELGPDPDPVAAALREKNTWR
ncbi:hypothetical protein GCM10011512_22760 [Tersicoccus solisilvae]|uniref:Uncharacterized protein n=1 Tax=Tersicoccus solisilvae TaxID=1882339 RepID=A0ABQ1PDM5_9MICC|nr:hypothetical protein [Tersicoccus solisilvae]GGC95163.1 hypothetical protein GCM10011512_22760 [Tersicoccus solisilvae]